MSRSFLVDDALAAYLAAHSPTPTPLQLELIEETARLSNASMQIESAEATFLQFLVKVSGARSILEIGTFTGYSALAMASVLPTDGRLVACDVSGEWTSIGRSYWDRAGVTDKIDLRLGRAIETLTEMPEEPTFDLVFIDADKTNYPQYLDLVVLRLVTGGLLVADNTLWSGRVIDAGVDDADTVALRRFNAAAAADERLDTQLLPLFDGLLIAVKR